MQAGITFRPAARVAEPSELAADRRAVTLAAGAVPWARSASSGVAEPHSSHLAGPDRRRSNSPR
jgi:hypothetical protein